MKIVSVDQDIFAFPYTMCSDCLEPLKEQGIEIYGYSDKPEPTEEILYDRMKDAEIVFGAYTNFRILCLPDVINSNCSFIMEWDTRVT